MGFAVGPHSCRGSAGARQVVPCPARRRACTGGGDGRWGRQLPWRCRHHRSHGQRQDPRIPASHAARPGRAGRAGSAGSGVAADARTCRASARHRCSPGWRPGSAGGAGDGAHLLGCGGGGGVGSGGCRGGHARAPGGSLGPHARVQPGGAAVDGGGRGRPPAGTVVQPLDSPRV